MPVLSAEFLCSAADLSQCPQDEVIEIAFVGRSNAGKSSSLNRIMGNKKLARVSKTPGRTRLINLFTTSSGYRIVDLPGYGYAKASQREQARWRAAVNDYLEERPNLRGLVLVMDARHPLKTFDQRMLHWACARELPTLVLLNKTDKLKRNAQSRTLRASYEFVHNHDAVTVQLFSAVSGQGLEAVVAWFKDYG